MNTIQFAGECSKSFEVQWHTHEHWELVYCTGGGGTFKFKNGMVLPYREGDTVAIPPGERHANLSQEGFSNIHVQMADPAFPSPAVFRVVDDAERHLRATFSQAKFYYLSDINKRDMVLSALGELIACYMAVYRDNTEFSKPVEQIRTLIIREHARPGFALDEAIRAMPFHYDYLRKLFKKEMGLTPLEYMTKLRMRKAEALLGGMGVTGYTVGEVAELCGYENALYFSRVFKKYFGRPPSALAARNRGGGGGSAFPGPGEGEAGPPELPPEGKISVL